MLFFAFMANCQQPDCLESLQTSAGGKNPARCISAQDIKQVFCCSLSVPPGWHELFRTNDENSQMPFPHAS